MDIGTTGLEFGSFVRFVLMCVCGCKAAVCQSLTFMYKNFVKAGSAFGINVCVQRLLSALEFRVRS